MSGEGELIRYMASLLKSGASMLDKSCPTCNVPLFRLKSGEIICPKCEKRFVFVETDEEELEVRGNFIIQSLEYAAINKINTLKEMLARMNSLDDIVEISDAILRLLRIVELSRSVRKNVFTKETTKKQ